MKINVEKIIENLRKVRFMGAINVTPDSFSDGGLWFDTNMAVEHASKLIEQGAEIIDIGGESTRPGAKPVSRDEELSRTIPIIEKIRKANKDIIISIDTYKSIVARYAIQAGANWVNDISGGTFSENMFELVAESNAYVVISHIKGTPRDMQKNPHYEDVVSEIRGWLQKRSEKAIDAGISKDHIILDPGIGFGKRFIDNIDLIWGINELKRIGFPVVLIGTSRKSFIGHYTDEKSASKRDPGSFATFILSASLGVDILRVHDVAGAKQAITMTIALLEHVPPGFNTMQ
jgi:dihydropteroate synthase